MIDTILLKGCTDQMSMIPDAILGVERALSANEISPYKIYAGPGGTWKRSWYYSQLPELSAYRFYLRSVIGDKEGLYYLTITKPLVNDING